jgi:hypothetical protein
LQGCADGLSDRGVSAVGGYGRLRRDAQHDTASSNSNCELAIFGDCRGTPRGIQDRWRSSGGGTQYGDAVGRSVRHTPTGEAETSKAERVCGNSGSIVPPLQMCRTDAQAHRTEEEGDAAKMADLFHVEIGSPPGFRNYCRVHTASPPMSPTSKPAAMRVFYPGADTHTWGPASCIAP